MGNQIKFSSNKEKQDASTESLEVEYIQLKATNRKLIGKLDKQKQLIKKLQGELERVRKDRDFADFNQLKREYQNLKGKNENLEAILLQSKEEISRLKKELQKFTKDKDENKTSRWDRLKLRK